MNGAAEHGERVRRFLAELPEGRKMELLHLLSCPECRGAARESLGAEPQAGPPEPAPDYGEVLEAVRARVPALVQQMAEQEAEARRLMSELLAHPAEQQLALVRSPRFASLDLVDLLLRESAGTQPEDPARAEGLALLALPILYQRRKGKGAERLADLKARAYMLLGNARRLQRDLEDAEARFREAAFHLTGPPDGIERAFYCQMLAVLRRDQHRHDEAAALLRRAAGLFQTSGDVLEEGACLAEVGFLYLAQGQIPEALAPLVRACPMVVLHRDGRLAARALLALAVCRAATGRPEPARKLVAFARKEYSHAADSAQMAELTWMEGRVALLLGDREDAATLLDTARNAFLSLGNVYDAALASLDLVLALPRARRRAVEIHPLTHALAERFPPDLDGAEAVKALAVVEMAAAGLVEGRFEDVVTMAAERLRRVRLYPQLRLPSPFPTVRPAEAEGENVVPKLDLRSHGGSGVPKGEAG